MSASKIGKVLPWSYSSLQSFETCPYRHWVTRITKQVTERQTEATLEGNRRHKALEHAVAGTKPLPQAYAKDQPMVDKLQATPGQKFTEFSFGITSSLAPSDFWNKDGRTWARGKLDLTILRDNTAILLDYKTGKRKTDVDQLRMFSLAGFSLWPHVKTIKTGYVWLLGGTIDAETFKREDVVEIHRDFAHRVHRMEVAEQTGNWPKRPSGLCREWCPVGRSLCEHCGKP